MRVAVSGASGFIGRHVLAELKRHRVDIVALSRHERSREDELGLRWIQLDLAQRPEVAWAKLGAPDVFLHLAWDGLPNYKSLRHFDRELPLQYAFLSGLVREGLGSLVTVGTCFEYGMRSGELEAAIATNPANPYGFAKDALRRQLEFLRAEHSYKFTWARLFYVYGSGQASGSLLPQLEAAVSAGHSRFNMSPGDQLRDFISVSDVAQKLVAMTLAGREYGVVNICSGKPVSVRQFIEQRLAERGWNIDLNPGFYPYPDYEPRDFWGLPGPYDD